jgi:membrane-bound transcription factor site-1 protease|tara:strand:+ start:121 stop:372 length:252 start_codon:yes stop_codon:yes gene_type:complete
MKQALVEGADVIAGGPMIYEQGAGKLNLHASREILRDYTPRASLVPGSLDFTKCPYMWPHCRQASVDQSPTLPEYSNAQLPTN